LFELSRQRKKKRVADEHEQRDWNKSKMS
jgi:hypothetical protein